MCNCILVYWIMIILEVELWNNILILLLFFCYGYVEYKM